MKYLRSMRHIYVIQIPGKRRENGVEETAGETMAESFPKLLKDIN